MMPTLDGDFENISAQLKHITTARIYTLYKTICICAESTTLEKVHDYDFGYTGIISDDMNLSAVS